MARRFTAHDLADYARCPRAWWYEHHLPAVRLNAQALEIQLAARRAALGARAAHDPETLLLLQLKARRERFTAGRLAHGRDAGSTRPRRRYGYVLQTIAIHAILLLLIAMLLLLIAMLP